MRLNREPLDTPHRFLTEKLSLGVNDTRDTSFMRATLLGARTVWGAAARNEAGTRDANDAIRKFIHAYPFNRGFSSGSKQAKDQAGPPAKNNSVDEGRKLMERFIKYRDSLKDAKNTDGVKQA